jgi:glyoxylate utilization-related uncharacterized protein
MLVEVDDCAVVPFATVYLIVGLVFLLGEGLFRVENETVTVAKARGYLRG